MKSLSLILFAAMASLALLSPSMAQLSPDPQHDPYAYNRFSPSMAIIIVVLIAALFFMGFFSIYIRHCSDGTSAGAAGVSAGAGATRRATRGLDASVIATFPTLEYSAVKGLKIGKGALECAVCLCEFEEDETLRLIPKCDHVFHPECIDTWLELRTTCPVCRADLSLGEAAAAAPEAPDIENQNDTVALAPTVEEDQPVCEPVPPRTLRRNRTRGASLSGGTFKRFFPRSHSTGHSLVQPGESTERFTLRLPAEVRKEIVNRQLHRTSSMVVQPTEGSSRGGKYTRRSERLGKSDRLAKSDRWIFTRTSSFFARMSSMKSPKVAATDTGEGPSKRLNVDPES